MIVDPIVAIIDILKANAAVTILVSTRVFGDEMPRAETASMPRKSIVIKSSGGGVFSTGSADYIEHSDMRFDAFCYGETPFQSNRVRREVYDVLKQLKRQVINGILVHWVNPAGGLLTLRDPDTQWPVAFNSFQGFFSERLVA